MEADAPKSPQRTIGARGDEGLERTARRRRATEGSSGGGSPKNTYLNHSKHAKK